MAITLAAVASWMFRGARAQDEIKIHLSFDTSNYAPTEYRTHARILPVAGSDIIFTADMYRRGRGQIIIPLNPTNYIFEWTWRGVPRKELGKNLFRVSLDTMPDVGAASINLKVRDRFSESVLAEESISVPIISPAVLLYEVDDGKVSGIASAVFPGKPGQTLTILAQPYFFNAPSDQLEYEWRHQGERIGGTPEDPRFLAIKIPAGASGYQEQFSVTVKHRQNILEFANQSFVVEVR